MEDLLYDDIEITEYDSIAEDTVIEDQEQVESKSVSVDKEMGEKKDEDKSSDFVLSSDDIYSHRGTKSINLDNDIEGFEKTLLFNGPENAAGNYILNFPYKDFDYILISYYGTNSINKFEIIISKENLDDLYNADYSNNKYSSVGLTRNISYGTSTKVLYTVSDNYINFTGGNPGQAVYIDKIYGLKVKKSGVTDNPTDSENNISGGNTIINNYYGCISDNFVSGNIMTKPLSEYNTAESFCAFGCLFALGIGLYLLIRKVIYKWQ